MQKGIFIRSTDNIRVWEKGVQRQAPRELHATNAKVLKGSVEISNRYQTVTLHEDGRMDIRPHAQMF